MNRYQGPVHLLLTDVVMRDMGGVELAEYFARMRPGIPVIYMSGYNEHLWFREDMTVNLIQKPFSATALLKKIRSLLDQPVGLS
jgi:DNA-binding NtrC family response regulator